MVTTLSVGRRAPPFIAMIHMTHISGTRTKAVMKKSNVTNMNNEIE